ncbi:hypothetical protein [Helicobacter acinonychis]|uniref:hypothetical protein n=1 Tax=Helicobacter acinonychis TaxID=212 RepID=UPI00398939E0
MATTHKIYENHTTHTKEPQATPKSTISKNTTALFTTKNIPNLTFYSQNLVYASAVNGSVTIQNFLPHNLHNVELSFKDKQGKIINLGVCDRNDPQTISNCFALKLV